MSYSADQVFISKLLSDINEGINFVFKFDNYDFINNVDKVNVIVYIILDVVYLKRKISLFNNIYNIDNKCVNVDIKDFKLDSVPHNELFNISKLCFEFYDCKDNTLLDTKNIILQIVQEKNKIYKHLI